MRFDLLPSLAFVLPLFASLAYALPIPVSLEIDAREPLTPPPPIPGSGLSIDVTTTLKPLGSRSSLPQAGYDHLLVELGGMKPLGQEGLATALARFLTGHLSGFKGAYHWTAPNGWVRPTSYEFGSFHTKTGAWINGQIEVLAVLKRLEFVKLPIEDAASLFPVSHGYNPIRDADRTRLGKFGYIDQDDVFVDIESDIDASILLGLCGYIKI